MKTNSRERGWGQASLIVIILVVVGGLAVGYSINKQKKEKAAMVEKTRQEEAMKKDKKMMDEKMDKEGEEMMDEKSDDSMMKSDDAMMMMPETKTFNLTGRNFAFSQAEIKVKKGAKVVVSFESAEGFHDWTVDGYNIGTTQIAAGGKTSVEFVADKAGTFEYYCSVGNHRQAGMVGKLIVE